MPATQHAFGFDERDQFGDMAILLVEQYYDFAQQLADDYLVMQRGKFVAQGLGADTQADGVRQLVSI